jgi:hypothetical protein
MKKKTSFVFYKWGFLLLVSLFDNLVGIKGFPVKIILNHKRHNRHNPEYSGHKRMKFNRKITFVAIVLKLEMMDGIFSMPFI